MNNQQSGGQSDQVTVPELSTRSKPATALSGVNQEDSQRVPGASDVVVVTEEDSRGDISDEEGKVRDGAQDLKGTLETTDSDDRESGEEDCGNREPEGDINGIDTSIPSPLDLVVEPSEDAGEDDGKGELEESEGPDTEL